MNNDNCFVVTVGNESTNIKEEDTSTFKYYK